MNKGKCMKDQIVYGLVTITDKGQISIPVNIRRELNIDSGDKLFIIKRQDCAGFTFVKLDMIDKLMNKIRNDEEFFEKPSLIFEVCIIYFYDGVLYIAWKNRKLFPIIDINLRNQIYIHKELHFSSILSA